LLADLDSDRPATAAQASSSRSGSDSSP
jgi:hypothetical protein